MLGRYDAAVRLSLLATLKPYKLSRFVHCVLWVYCVAYGRRYRAFNSFPFHQLNKPKKLNKLNEPSPIKISAHLFGKNRSVQVLVSLVIVNRLPFQDIVIDPDLFDVCHRFRAATVSICCIIIVLPVS